MQLGQIEHSETVASVTYSAQLAAWVCQGCGLSVISDDALAVLERRMTEMIAKGPPGPDAMRLLRKWLGIKSSDLAELLLTRPETLSRWENARQTLDPNAFGLLARMVLEDLEGRDDTRRFLAQRAHPPLSPVSLGLIGSPLS